MAAALALITANSQFSSVYFALLGSYVGPFSVLHWINDALMAVFFLFVGLEIKREFVDGELATWPRRFLPGVAATAGMALPAAVFTAINWHTPENLRGWAIPAATDIAFALGVLALLGSRVPVSLKIFLTAVAIVDDLGAIAVIAVFYTDGVSLAWLGLAAVACTVLVALNLRGIERLWPYLVIGVLLWLFVLKSGIHATLAGVVLAMAIPLRPSPGRPEDAQSPLHILEHRLHGWVSFVIVPVFGFANAGVSLTGLSVANLLAPLPLGIAAGLFFGKQIGLFLAVWIVVKLRLAERPAYATWPQVYGVCLLSGIGFTMSLFIGVLGFPDSAGTQAQVKVGVLVGSILSAVVGAVLLMCAPARFRQRG